MQGSFRSNRPDYLSGGPFAVCCNPFCATNHSNVLLNAVVNAMFKFIRNLKSKAHTSSDQSGQPNQQNAAPRDTLDHDISVQTNPPPYHPTLTTSRDSTTHSEDSDPSYGAGPLQFYEHNVLLSTSTQHHRETSTGASLIPLNEENAGSEEAVFRHDTVCTCRPRQGCCSDHNSIRTPNPAPLALLGTSRDVFIRTSNTSAFTLTPIHHLMQYHLSMNNLSCISRRLSPETETMFIPELSFKGSASSDQDTQHRWSSEVYYDKGTFLQIQEINTAFYRNDENPPEHFRGCPHQSLSVHTPDFRDRDGMCEAEAWITSTPSRCRSHPMQKWSNFQGPYTHITSCTICHADTECYIELNGSYLDVRYTCFRDLGTGTDPNDPKWHSLLTGGGTTHRPKHEFEVLMRVWDTALKLRRSNLYDVPHQTPNGMFHVRSGFRDGL
ncbi:hypothetical protein GGI35DRAFT_463325 [Trichoderma velutinum]